VDLLRFYTQDGGTAWFGTSENDESNVAGSDSQVIFNDGGTAAGDSGFTFNKTNNTVDLGGGTVTASDPVLDLSQTWNNGAVTFTGLKLNVTNTASDAASNFLVMQSGASPWVNGGDFAVSRNAGLTFGNSNLDSASITIPGAYFNFSHLIIVPRIAVNGTVQANAISFSYSSEDTFLTRDSANVLAQRNGTNAQTLRIYRSYTDTSNYSRWTVKWNTSTAILHAEGAGTGSDGSVAFNDAALATDAKRGFLMIPSCAGTPTGTPADIPTGQAPIVYDSTNKKLAVWDGAAWVQTAALT